MSGFDSSQRGAVLAQCFEDFKQERKAGGPPADAWMWKYMGDYATRARAKLGPKIKSAWIKPASSWLSRAGRKT
jgi:hypothetical protein